MKKNLIYVAAKDFIMHLENIRKSFGNNSEAIWNFPKFSHNLSDQFLNENQMKHSKLFSIHLEFRSIPLNEFLLNIYK
jgi:hypothetical protein